MAVLNGIGVVGAGWIGVGNGDGLIVFNGVSEGELNGGTGDGNTSDGIGAASGCNRESRCGSCCGRERLVVSEDDLAAVAVGGSRLEGRWCASNGGVIGDRGAA